MLHTIILALQVIKMLNSSLHVLQNLLKNDLPPVIFMSSLYNTPGRSKIHAKCVLGILPSSTYKHTTMVALQVIKMLNLTRFTAYFYRNISKMTPHVISMSSLHSCLLGGLKYMPNAFWARYIVLSNTTEDSTYDNSSLTRDLDVK